jgi:hypothetical protein
MQSLPISLGILSALGFCFAYTLQAQNAYPYTIDTLPKQSSSGPVPFRKLKIQNEGNIESTAFGDMNGDKVLDIVSGNHWFAGPSFQTKTKFRLLSTADRTTPDDMTVTMDVDGDGYDDVISGGHNIGLFWYHNPGKVIGAVWTRDIIDAERPPDGKVDTAIASGLPHTLGWHSGGLVDVDGDGKAMELLSTGVRAAETLTMRWYRVENKHWVKHDVGLKCEMWGSGMGDVNGDGRADIICPDAWLEAPLDRASGAWVKHPFVNNICNVKGEPEPKITNAAGAISGHATQIYTYDVNKDGLNDILLSSGHGNGIFWYQQAKSSAGVITFLERNIDSSWYQSHNLEFKDLNNDGIPDLVTGKRWGGWGPNERAANSIFWYQMIPGAANPWKRHAVSFDEKYGMGCKGDLRDFDGDGDLDIVATSIDAGGTVLFVNELKIVSINTKTSQDRFSAYSRLLPGSHLSYLMADKGRLQLRSPTGRLMLSQEVGHGL